MCAEKAEGEGFQLLVWKSPSIFTWRNNTHLGNQAIEKDTKAESIIQHGRVIIAGAHGHGENVPGRGAGKVSHYAALFIWQSVALPFLTELALKSGL